MKLVFLGTPAIAVVPLRGLHEAGHEIKLVVTAPPARRGRGTSESPTPVGVVADELGLPVSHRVDDVLDVDAELGVVVAFGQILRSNVLDHVPFVNLHFSLLPRWRGAAPVERAILAGDAETGVCVMAVDAGLDTGGVYARAATEVDSKTLGALWTELSELGTALLVDQLATGLSAPEPQVGEPTYATKLTADERRIDWTSTPEQQLRVVRLGNAWTVFEGRRLKVIDAKLDADGSFEPTVVQPEGKRPMAMEEWVHGLDPSQRGRLSSRAGFESV